MFLFRFVLLEDERSNRLLVLRTQRQSWRERSSDERLVSKDHHYAILQEAAGLVFEDRRLDQRAARGTSLEDLQVAADIMADLQHHQDVESHMLSTLHSKVCRGILNGLISRDVFHDQQQPEGEFHSFRCVLIFPATATSTRRSFQNRISRCRGQFPNYS